MKILYLLFKTWLIGFIIIFPIVLGFCKSAKFGDNKNKLVMPDKK